MKPFTPVVPEPLKGLYENFQFAPAVIANGVIHVSGQIGIDRATGKAPPDLETQLDILFNAMAAVLAEAGAEMSDVFSLNSYHVGDLPSQMRAFIAAKAKHITAPHPAWTAVGVTSLAAPGLLVEVSALAVQRK